MILISDFRNSNFLNSEIRITSNDFCWTDSHFWNYKFRNKDHFNIKVFCQAARISLRKTSMVLQIWVYFTKSCHIYSGYQTQYRGQNFPEGERPRFSLVCVCGGGVVQSRELAVYNLKLPISSQSWPNATLSEGNVENNRVDHVFRFYKIRPSILESKLKKNHALYFWYN